MSSVRRTEIVCKYIISIIVIEKLTIKQIARELPDF